MTTSNFQIGQRVTFINGDRGVYNGEIVRIEENKLSIIEDTSGMILWNAGWNTATEITFEQVKPDNFTFDN